MIDRRHFLLAASASAASACLLAKSGSASPAPNPQTDAAQTDAAQTGKMPVQFSLNTSTIRGHKLSITEQVDVASNAGYDGIEPWIRDLEEYVTGGGNLPDLKKRIEDSGLAVVSAIGFAKWIVDDDAERAAGLEQAKRDMELVKAIGGTRMAAPPIGAHGGKDTSPPLEVIAQRYRALLEVGDATGVVPQLELWGFSPTLSKLPELAYVAAGAEHDSACVLPDFYHIYKGGSDFSALGMIEASRMHCFHINDYPDNPPRKDIADKDRVFPGDGVCALPQIIRGLIDNGFTGTFSLELFNPEYWQRDALEVAKEGLEKSKAVVSQAIAL
ncbi:sugar phosphate isomerase/epimerase family protein [Stieleria varia]|uniref:Inosose isomerase n=1 Tax=Stieleria varia TaxID=2528005 RepID=A0A5C6A334_9BACT|nr:sugar phosphate isomerase/epimerase family protein [Stieleria varia]TWT92813.1 Inosose isomerase [Stieleria varia]